MSASKRYYESNGWTGSPAPKTEADNYYKFETGQRFIITDNYNKSKAGHWEVECESNLKGVYLCNRVLKNGSLSKSDARSNFRGFGAIEIYEALNEND